MNQWRFEEAEAAYLRAIELAPGLSMVHSEYSQLLSILERFEEAEVEARQAIELDPWASWLIENLGWVHWSQKDWDGAIREARRAIEVDPTDPYPYMLLGNSLGMRGDHSAALEAFEAGRQRFPTLPLWTVATANAYAKAGHPPEALRLLEKVLPDASSFMLIQVAEVHGTLGDTDKAFALLDSLARADPYQLVILGSDRDADPLRDDPRFEAVQRRAREEVERRNQTY
jgi:tetratricopeptide (TPR) repeat protein